MKPTEILDLRSMFALHTMFIGKIRNTRSVMVLNPASENGQQLHGTKTRKDSPCWYAMKRSNKWGVHLLVNCCIT